MRISDWSSDVCSSDLGVAVGGDPPAGDGVDPASTVGGMETGVFGVRNQRDGIAEAVLGEGVPDGGGDCGHAVRPLHRFVIPAKAGIQLSSCLFFAPLRLCVRLTNSYAKAPRSEARRVGTECVNTCRARRWPSH